MKLLQKAIAWGRKKSPWIIHFNAGACNGCDIEVVDSLTPRFDLERLGIIQKGSPRHADILVCTGAVTLQTRDRLKQIYDQMSSPKFVIAVGTCACTGGIFDGCYCVMGGIDTVIPVDAYIPGCAVRPEAIIHTVEMLLDSLEKKEKKAKKESKKQKRKNKIEDNTSTLSDTALPEKDVSYETHAVAAPGSDGNVKGSEQKA